MPPNEDDAEEEDEVAPGRIEGGEPPTIIETPSPVVAARDRWW